MSLNDLAQNEPIASPCIGICQMDDEGRYCIGCGRTTAEIAGWTNADNTEKSEIIHRAVERKPLENEKLG